MLDKNIIILMMIIITALSVLSFSSEYEFESVKENQGLAMSNEQSPGLISLQITLSRG